MPGSIILGRKSFRDAIRIAKIKDNAGRRRYSPDN